MRIAAFGKPLQTAFFQWGWLVVAVLPLAQIGGRALYTVLVSLYALWGLPGLWSRRDRLDRATTGLYLALLSVTLYGLSGSVDPEGGLRVWVQFALQSMTLLLLQVALWESPAQPDRLFAAFALCGTIHLLIMYAQLPYYALGWSGEPFDPSSQLREDNLPFLLMFQLGWLWRRGGRRWRYAAMAAVTMAVLVYVVLSEGRAALLGMSVGLAVFGWVVLGWRLRWVIPVVALIGAIAIAANVGAFQKMASGFANPLDAFTTGRSILWRQALEHPPVRPWLGVGMGNESHVVEMLSFTIGGVPVQVKHLHNFLLDAWYETGILGSGLLVILIATALGRLLWIWQRLTTEDRQRSGVLLAATLALMTSGLLSFSYTSRQLACYLFVCLAGLIAFSGSPANGRTDPGRR